MLSVLSMGRVAVNRLLRRLLACQALAVALFARSSFAEAEDDGPANECPRPADVLAGLAQVVTVTSRFAPLSADDIVIHDYGESWAVEVRGRSSTYSDAARDCVERARVATVFAALVLEPVDADRPLAEPLAALPPSPQPLVAASVAGSAASADRPAAGPERTWHVGVRSSFDYFSGGSTLMGGDVFVASSWGRCFLAELGAGGRVGSDEPVRGGQLTIRAATVAASGGLVLISRGRLAGSAVVAQVQGHLVHFAAQQSGQHPEQTALLDAWTVAAEPRLALALTRRLSLAASVGVGYALRPIVIREQGASRPSMSGLVLSGHVGGDFSF
jgi:hypothetical protein